MDIRAQKTKEAFQAALLACMEENLLKDIKVKDIYERAGLNKSTFYKYYRDVEALAAETEMQQLAAFSHILQQGKHSGEEMLRIILDSLEQAEALYHVRSGGAFSASFRTGLISTAMNCGMEAWRKRLPDMDPEKAALIYEMLLAGALQAVSSRDITADREWLVKTVMEMFRTCIRAYQQPQSA